MFGRKDKTDSLLRVLVEAVLKIQWEMGHKVQFNSMLCKRIEELEKKVAELERKVQPTQ